MPHFMHGSHWLIKIAHCPVVNGCRIWQGATDRGWADIRLKGKLIRVARLLLEHKLGRPIRPGYEACHSCGTRACVDVNHIYEGTHHDNMQDRKKHDGYLTAAKGEEHGNATLTDAIVRSMRKSGLGPSAAARHYGTSQATAFRVLNYQSWKHVKN